MSTIPIPLGDTLMTFPVWLFCRTNRRWYHYRTGSVFDTYSHLRQLGYDYYCRDVEEPPMPPDDNVRKLKGRIAELESRFSSQPPALYVSHHEYVRVCNEAHGYKKERDLARKTLDEVRALINGQKL